MIVRYLRHNLLVQFSVVSFVMLTVIALILAVAVSMRIRANAVEDLIDEAVGVTSHHVLIEESIKDRTNLVASPVSPEPCHSERSEESALSLIGTDGVRSYDLYL